MIFVHVLVQELPTKAKVDTNVLEHQNTGKQVAFAFAQQKCI